MTIDVSYETDEGEEIVLTFPSKNVVCPDCQGEGYVLCDGMRGHAYSMEEFYQEFDDEEDREAYFTRGGKYDQVCPTCKGKNVVAEIDEEHIPASMQEKYQEYLKHDEVRQREEAEYRAMCRAEELAGC